jgi:hypothetical protein
MTKTVLAMVAALSITGCIVGDESAPAGSFESTALQSDLKAAKQATAKYHDFAVATADGYVNTGLPCIEGQGFHYIKGSLIGTNDVTLPQLLMYLPDATGTLQLVALEWIEPIADATTKPLTLFGQTFHGPEHVDGVPFDFFGLHVWSWQSNPSGLFSDTNPNIHCR